jgi:hypothetical protein
MQSEIGFMEALNDILRSYGPVKIYYNNKLIWDDDLSLDEGWITLYEAIEKFKASNPKWDKIKVHSIKIDIVQFHHSIVHFEGGVG